LNEYFLPGDIWAYPTDTSFGLGVRADDRFGMEKLYHLKKRSGEKFFSLMVRDESMLHQFAEVGDVTGINSWIAWFAEKPRTAIFKSTDLLPRSPYWPREGVAFRINQVPVLDSYLEYPITATSANISGEQNIYSKDKLVQCFEKEIEFLPTGIEVLPVVRPSEIWDFTNSDPKLIRA